MAAYFIAFSNLAQFFPRRRIDGGERLATDWINKFTVDEQL